MKVNKEYLNLRLVHHKNTNEAEVFYLGDHSKEIVRDLFGVAAFNRNGKMIPVTNEDYISKMGGKPTPLTSGEIGAMLGIGKALGRDIQDYIYESNKLFNSITKEAAASYQRYFEIPILKAQPKESYYLESADYSNDICIVRSVMYVSDSKTKLDEKAKELKVTDPTLNYLVWPVKKI